MITQYQGGQNIHKYYEDGPPEFPDIQQDHFELKDKSTIAELQTLHKNSVQMSNVIQHLGDTLTQDEQTQYRQRQDKLISVFNTLGQTQMPSLDAVDNFAKPADPYSTPYQNYEYYDLKDIVYDDKQTISDAFAFLQSLNKANPDLTSEKMDIEQKPLFKKIKKAKLTEALPTNKLSKQMQLLSFQDE